MLIGSLHYILNGKTYVYDIKGYDTSSVTYLKLTSPSLSAMLLTASDTPSDVDEALIQEECRVDLGLSKVVVSVNKYTNNAGKTVKANINSNLFCKLNALVAYAKQCCTKKNEVGFTDLQLASNEFETTSKFDYIINFPNSTTVFARVSLEYGAIFSIKLATDDILLTLEDDKGLEMEVFPKITNGFSAGFRFNKDYLGFDIPKDLNKSDVSSLNGMYTCLDDIIKCHPDKEFSWLLGKNYNIVTDDNLEEVCKYIREYDGYVYYDTETTGLGINFLSRVGKADQLVGVVLSVKYGESFFFPCQMKQIPNLCDGDHWYFMTNYMKPILEGKELVAHNLAFDWKVGYIYDINCNIVHDTQSLIRLTLGAEREDYPMGLKENTRLLLNRDSLELSDLIIDDSWGESDIRFWDLPEELVRLYACADTDNTNGLLQYAIKTDLLKKYGATKIYEIELAFSYAVGYQEFYGHRIDINNLESVRKVLGEEQDACMKQMEEMVGHTFNANSPNQLVNILYTELRIPMQNSRKTGRPTTDKETLKKLAEITDIEDNIMYPFVNLLLKYREYEGVRKIVDKFPEHMTKDGYIFSSVMQFGTTTGRVSINKPNYQSYNDPIKKNVIPRPGFYEFDTDYSSVEYRVLCNMVGNERIKKSFEDPDFDYHAYQAAHMYSVPYSAVTKKLRKAAKGINFGLPYGMGDESLGIRVFGEATPENTRKAGALRLAYFKGQEDIRDWFEYHRDKGVNLGYTETFFGRRRYYNKAKFDVRSIRRQAGNQVIQGTAADLYKMAVGKLFKRICREGWLGKVLFTCFVHDELVCEISNDIDPMVWLRVAREEFEVKVQNDDGSPWCPLYMGCGFGRSWYEAKSVELPIKLQWEMVENFGTDGLDDWNGNAIKFCDSMEDRLRDFEIRDIRKQLLDADSQGKEIKPTLNTQLLDCVKTDAKLYTKAINDYIQSGDYPMIQAENMPMSVYLEMVEKEITQYMDEKYHIQNLYRDDDGNFVDSFEASRETQGVIKQFCMLHGVDFIQVDLRNIEEFVASDKNTALPVMFRDDYEDDEDSADAKQRRMDMRVDNFGLYVDIDEKVITLKLVPQQYLDFIKAHSNTNNDGYVMRFKDCENKKMYICKSYIASKEINIIQEMYLNYFKQGGK